MPHTHVQRNLSVIASEERVRVVDPEAPEVVLADHPRTFDRDQRIEQEGHVRALVEQKRRAHQSRGFDRLFSVVPSARIMMEVLAERGENLGGATSGLLQLLDRIGADLLERAVAEVVARDRLSLRDVHHEVDRLERVRRGDAERSGSSSSHSTCKPLIPAYTNAPQLKRCRSPRSLLRVRTHQR